jgi:RNA polymerase sigma-70 factor, ECF subfamily
MTPEERQAALQRARQGDRTALGELLESFRPYLRCIVHAQGGNQLQAKMGESDLVQDGLLEAHRSFGTFRGTTVEELAGWLRQIVVRTTGHALRAYRQTAMRDQTREQSLDGLASVVAGSASTPSSQAIRHEESAQLAAALSRLPDDMQQVLLGRHLENLSYDALAERLGRSPGATRVLYTRALRRLREECAGSRTCNK